MVDGNDFRAALGRFASGVTVVTLLDGNGAPLGLTVSAFSSVSLEPPLILVCISRKTASHDAFLTTSGFTVNVLSAQQESVSRQFASRLPDKFSGVAWTPGRGGVPRIEGALATLECSLSAHHAAGDHTIVVGQVEAITVADGAPLLYFRGAYAGVAERAPAKSAAGS